MKLLSGLALAILLLAPIATFADEANLAFGGDQYAAGQNTGISAPVGRDAFAAGFDVSVKAPVTGDAHLAGYNVNVDAAVAGDLYAGGSSISVTSPVGGDMTALGSTVAVRAAAPIAGNVRVAGAAVTIAAPVTGSALITAQSLTLDGAIAGDLNFFGESITFRPGAKVGGTVTIQAPKEISVPPSVAAADQVTFTQLVAPDYAAEAGKTAEHVVRGVWPAIWATGLWWLLLAVVGLMFIAFGGKLVGALQTAAESRPFRNLGIGILGFASIVGLVPVFALTLIGIFLLPFVFVFVAVSCALAYLAGTYLVGGRVARAMMPIDSNLKRSGVLVASIVVAGFLGMIPVVGWLLTLLLTVFGFGAFGLLTMVRWTAGDAAHLAAPNAA